MNAAWPHTNLSGNSENVDSLPLVAATKMRKTAV
jgi:hypothetical protein